MEVIGWVGSIMLALCGLPQAIKSYRTKSSKDISIWFLILWLLGEVLTLVYVFPKLDWPLIMNYSFNIGLICVILKYR